MVELLLFGQVPQARHEQVLQILCGVAAIQPRRHFEYHAVFQPTREPTAPGRNMHIGGTQGVAQKQSSQHQANKDLYYTHLVKTPEEADFGGPSRAEPEQSAPKTDDADDASLNGVSVQPRAKWTFHFNDVPDPVKRPVTLRMTSQTDILAGDPVQYMAALGYRYITDYVLEGHRFVHKNIVIFLCRIMRFPTDTDHHQTTPRASFPPLSSLIPLDESGAYVLQALIRVGDSEKPNVLSEAISELEAFGKLMRGSVYMDVGDRLALDTRVKYRHKLGS